MTVSKIEWCGRSDWNPVRGCTRVSEGCRNCYAEGMAGRFSDPGQWGHGFATRHANGGRWTGRVELIDERLTLPLRWTRPARIFVNSTSDLFHENLHDEDIAQVLSIAAVAQQHTFIVVTKRAKRMWKLLSDDGFCDLVNGFTTETALAFSNPHARRSDDYRAIARELWHDTPLPNLWLLVSVEDQRAAEECVPYLLVTPAAVRGVSAEPLIAPVDLTGIDYNPFLDSLRRTPRPDPEDPNWPQLRYDALRGHLKGLDDVGLARLDWVITGGESGPKARPMHPAWARNLRDQCAAAGTPFFFKQWGSWAPASAFTDHIPSSRCFDWGDDDGPDEDAVWHVGKGAAGRLLDGRTWDQVPEALTAGGRP